MNNHSKDQTFKNALQHSKNNRKVLVKREGENDIKPLQDSKIMLDMEDP